MVRAKPKPPAPQLPKGNLWFVVGGPVLGLANNLFVQKHGNSVPDLVIWGIYFVAFVCLVVGIVRLERFAAAGGQLKQQAKNHPVSLSLVLLVVLCYLATTVTTLVHHRADIDKSNPPTPSAEPRSTQPAPTAASPDKEVPFIPRSEQQKVADQLEARKLVLEYRAQHPGSVDKKAELKWINVRLAREGIPFTLTYIRDIHSAPTVTSSNSPHPASKGGAGIIGAHGETDLDDVHVNGFATGIDLSPSQKAVVKHSTATAPGGTPPPSPSDGNSKPHQEKK